MERTERRTGPATRGGEFVELFEELRSLDAQDADGKPNADGTREVCRRGLERQLTNLLSTTTSFRQFRAFPRIRCELPVEVYTNDETPTAGTVVEIGSGGLLLNTHLRARRGDAIRISISSDDGGAGEPLTLHGAVAWTTDFYASETATLAVSFSVLGLDAVSHLERLDELQQFVRALARMGIGTI